MSKQSYFKRSKPMEGAQKHSLHPNNTIFQKGSIYDSELEECKKTSKKQKSGKIPLRRPIYLSS